MHLYTITFQRPDGTRFETDYAGLDHVHASTAAKVVLSCLGENDLTVVGYTRA